MTGKKKTKVSKSSKARSARGAGSKGKRSSAAQEEPAQAEGAQAEGAQAEGAQIVADVPDGVDAGEAPNPSPEPPSEVEAGAVRGDEETADGSVASEAGDERGPSAEDADPTGPGSELRSGADASDEDRDATHRQAHDANDDFSEPYEDADDENADDEGEPLAEEEGDALESEPSELSLGRDESWLPCILESLLFASDKPLRFAQLKKLVGARSSARLRKALEALAVARQDSGIVLVEVDGGYQLRTHPSNARWVRRLEEVRPVRMSRAALEVLAVVAYRQPTTRVEIDQIRGVDSGPVLKQLLQRDLVRIVGRKDEVGKPFLYGTTKEFLSFFSLSSLSDLPSLRDVAELAQEEIRATKADEALAARDAEPSPEEPGEVEAEEIAPTAEDAEELDEGDEEVLDALTAASEAARGADRVKRSLRKMASAESASVAPDSEAGKMFSSLQEVVAVQRKRRRGGEEGPGEGTAGAGEGAFGEAGMGAMGREPDDGPEGDEAREADAEEDGADEERPMDPERLAKRRAMQTAMEKEIAEEERLLGELDDLLEDDAPAAARSVPSPKATEEEMGAEDEEEE